MPQINKIKTKIMMRKMKLEIGILIGILLFLPLVNSSTINLGTIPDLTTLHLKKGDEGIFKISFFTLGDDPVNVKIKAEYPEDLSVTIIPDSFTLHKEVTTSPYECAKCGWFVLKDGKTFAKTTPVYIHVRIPSKISRNLYEVKLIATATSSGSTPTAGMSQSLVQSREFTLKAFVSGSIETPSLNYTKPETLTIKKVGTANTTTTPPGIMNITGLIPKGWITLPKEQKENVQNWIIIISVIAVGGVVIKKLLM